MHWVVHVAEDFDEKVVIVRNHLRRLWDLLILSLLDFLDKAKVVAIEIDWFWVAGDLDVRCLNVLFEEGDYSK